MLLTPFITLLVISFASALALMGVVSGSRLFEVVRVVEVDRVVVREVVVVGKTVPPIIGVPSIVLIVVLVVAPPILIPAEAYALLRRPTKLLMLAPS